MSLITDTLQQHGRDHWIEKLTGLGYVLSLGCERQAASAHAVHSVPFGPINDIEQTFAHPQVAAREMITEVEVRRAELSILTI